MALTREQLAAKAGISSKRIEQIERGNAGVRSLTAKALARSLKCHVSELVESAEVAS